MDDDAPADDRLGRRGLRGPDAAEPGPPRPWPLGGQYVVAAVGGSLALTAVAVVNAHRLGLRRSSLAAVAAAALAAVVLTGGAVAVLGVGDLAAALVSRVLALAACPLVLAAQQPADRTHRERAAVQDADYTYGSIAGAVLASLFVSFFFERTLALVIGA